jgi:hypothetical protein
MIDMRAQSTQKAEGTPREVRARSAAGQPNAPDAQRPVVDSRYHCSAATSGVPDDATRACRIPHFNS